MSVALDKLSGWNHGLAKALIEVGSEAFPSLLVQALHQLVDFDVCMVFAYGKVQGSISLHHNMSADQAKLLVDDYLMGPHLLDPFYAEAISGRRAGCCSMKELAPDEFYESEFYQYHYVRTGIKDEIGIFFPAAADRTAVLSVTRQEQRGLFTKQDKAVFASVAPLVMTFGAKHWGARAEVGSFPSSSTPINDVFESFGQDVLTEREQEIIALILKGHSSLSISHVLSITQGTVKIHRKNAYGKLDITSQAELFNKFLGLLEKRLRS